MVRINACPQVLTCQVRGICHKQQVLGLTPGGRTKYMSISLPGCHVFVMPSLVRGAEILYPNWFYQSMKKPLITTTKQQEDQIISKIEKEREAKPLDQTNSWQEFKKLLHPLVISIVKIYASQGYSTKGLTEAGERGLDKAIFHYLQSGRKEEKYKFSTYSTWWIRAEINKKFGLPID